MNAELRTLRLLCDRYRARLKATENELEHAQAENRRLRAALRNAHDANEALYGYTGGYAR